MPLINLIFIQFGAAKLYAMLKMLHILGVVLLVGNVTASAVWKVFADRTCDVRIVRFAQRLITIGDWSLTLPGILLIILGGYGMVYVNGLSLIDSNWLVIGQGLFAASGAIWVMILVPTQIRLAHEASRLSEANGVTVTYRAQTRSWLIWGIVATLPLAAAIYVMSAKL